MFRSRRVDSLDMIQQSELEVCNVWNTLWRRPKREATNWEKIGANHIPDKGLLSEGENLKSWPPKKQAIQSEKNKNKKNGQKTETLYQRVYRWKSHKKLPSGQFKFKLQWALTAHLSAWCKPNAPERERETPLPNARQDVERLDRSCIAVGNGRW